VKIAISGKGGVGKTSISAALARLFEKDGFNVYMLDADPDANLGLALGLEEESLSGFKALVEMKELIKERVGGEGGLFTLNPKVDDIIEGFSLRTGRIRLLKMGNVKKAATACYCPENSFLNAVVRALVLEKEDVVIMDMSAGIEHLTRGTAQGVDLMLILSEPTIASMRTARISASLARDLGLRRIYLVGNKVRDERERALIEKEAGEIEVLGFIPYDDSIFGSPLTSPKEDGGFWGAVRGIYERIRGICKS
jgi:CO dehydrogenase maturation factor